jgi:hypothetical protein
MSISTPACSAAVARSTSFFTVSLPTAPPQRTRNVGVKRPLRSPGPLRPCHKTQGPSRDGRQARAVTPCPRPERKKERPKQSKERPSKSHRSRPALDPATPSHHPSPSPWPHALDRVNVYVRRGKRTTACHTCLCLARSLCSSLDTGSSTEGMSAFPAVRVRRVATCGRDISGTMIWLCL